MTDFTKIMPNPEKIQLWKMPPPPVYTREDLIEKLETAYCNYLFDLDRAIDVDKNCEQYLQEIHKLGDIDIVNLKHLSDEYTDGCTRHEDLTHFKFD